MRAKVIIIALLLALAISSALFSGMNVGFVIPSPELNYSVFDTINEKYVIYNNRIYKQYIVLRDYPNFTDEYIGTLSDDDAVYKWNGNDFIKFGGNESGDYYAIKGYPSKHLICLRKENGDLEVFVSPYNVRINRGADVYERMYDLSSNLDSLHYYNIDMERSENISCEKEINTVLIADEHKEIAEFFGELNLLKFNEYDLNSIPRINSLCVLNVQSENGMRLQLSLCEGGYILGALPYCYQKMDEGKFNKFIDFLISMQTEENKEDINDNDWNFSGEIYEDEFISEYLPKFLPDGFSLSAYNSNAVYSYDKISGKRNGIKEAYVSLIASGSRYFNIEINDYKEKFSRNDAPDITLDKLNIEFIEDNLRTDTDYSDLNTKGKIWFACVVVYDDAAVKYTAIGIESEEIYKILSSVDY